MADNPLLITNTDVSGVLKNVYEDYRINAFPKLTPSLAQIKKARPNGPERMRWGGNGVFWDVVLTRPVGMTASDAGYFPNTAQAIERQASVSVKRLYVSRQIDSLAIQGTEAKEAAYISLARKLVQEAMDAAQLGQQEILHGDGRAIKGIIGTVTDTTHIIVASPYGIASSGRGGLLLDVGMYVAVLDTTGATLRGKATISAVANSGDNATLTLDTAIAGMVATDIVVAATTSDTSYNQFPNGFTNMFNRGAAYNSLHGISAGTFGRWDSVRLTAGTDTPDASTPTESDIWDLITRVANRSGKNAMTNGKEFMIVTTPGIVKKLAEQFFALRRFELGQMDIEGGFKALSICGLPLLQDYWCPAGTIYLIHTPSLAWVDRQDWVKLSYEGAGPWRWVNGRDAYEVDFGSYMNMCVLQRNSHGMITGYTDTVRYDHVV